MLLSASFGSSPRINQHPQLETCFPRSRFPQLIHGLKYLHAFGYERFGYSPLLSRSFKNIPLFPLLHTSLVNVVISVHLECILYIIIAYRVSQTDSLHVKKFEDLKIYRLHLNLDDFFNWIDANNRHKGVRKLRISEKRGMKFCSSFEASFSRK